MCGSAKRPARARQDGGRSGLNNWISFAMPALAQEPGYTRRSGKVGMRDPVTSLILGAVQLIVCTCERLFGIAARSME